MECVSYTYSPNYPFAAKALAPRSEYLHLVFSAIGGLILHLQEMLGAFKGGRELCGIAASSPCPSALPTA